MREDQGRGATIVHFPHIDSEADEEPFCGGDESTLVLTLKQITLQHQVNVPFNGINSSEAFDSLIFFDRDFV